MSDQTSVQPEPALDAGLVERIKRMAAEHIANVMNLPEWVRIPALGRELRPLVEAVLKPVWPLLEAVASPDVKTARHERMPPSPPEFVGESLPDRYHRIAKELREVGHIGHPSDQQFLFALYTEQSNAITWDTNCLSCSRTLDGAYEETAKREQLEALVATKNLTITALRGHLNALRIPLPIYGTSMNMRHAYGDRLTGYTSIERAVTQPEVGSLCIAVDLGQRTAVIARVREVRPIVTDTFDDTGAGVEMIANDRWAIDLDWLPEHW